MDDGQLRQNILDELEFEPRIDAANIGVAVEDGVATLTGHVPSYSAKLAAKEAVERVHGVRAIADEMEVRLQGSPQTSDDEIAKRAANILKWDALVPEEDIKISVRKGFVMLTGHVDWQYQRMAAEDAIRRLSHIAGVDNAIEIKPRPKAKDIRRKIEDALMRSAEAEARKIRVSVVDGTVTLEGHVDNWSERRAVENAAWAVPGVQKVNDRLVVI
ncbi:MAG: BON domain-containing protein [Rhodomicrobiaceae bacterium]